MTEELPTFLESIVFDIVEDRTKYSAEGSVELADIVERAAATRAGTTPERVLQVLHRFCLEGVVEQFNRSHYRVPMCVAGIDGDGSYDPDSGVA